MFVWDTNKSAKHVSIVCFSSSVFFFVACEIFAGISLHGIWWMMMFFKNKIFSSWMRFFFLEVHRERISYPVQGVFFLGNLDTFWRSGKREREKKLINWIFPCLFLQALEQSKHRFEVQWRTDRKQFFFEEKAKNKQIFFFCVPSQIVL